MCTPFFHVVINKILIAVGIKKEDKKRWHMETVALEFAVQGGSTSNDRGDCTGRYQCKIVGGDFIEVDNNGQ